MQQVIHCAYCLNGHYVGALTPSWREIEALAVQEWSPLPAFCTICGVLNISECQNCETPISVRYVAGSKPGYCGGCGKPFPWTKKALLAAKDYADELDEFSPQEKTELKAAFDDLTNDTPRTPLAVSRRRGFTAFNAFRKSAAPRSRKSSN
jgi:hypothetical protein